MAQKKGHKTGSANKTAAGSRKSPAPRTGEKSVSAKSGPSELRLRGDILILLALALSVLLFISNIGFGGVLGKALSSVSFGLFGLMAYVLPVLLFYCFLFILANGSGPSAGLRLGGLWGLYVFICAFFQLVLYGFEREYSFSDYYSQSALDHSGGGFCGGLLVKIFGTAFGTIGAYVVILVGLVIFTIMLTQKPLLTALRVHGGQAYDAALEQREERRELLQQRREARQAEQEERAREKAEEALAREERRRQREEEYRKQREDERPVKTSAESRHGADLTAAAAGSAAGMRQEARPLSIITLSDERQDPAKTGTIRTERKKSGKQSEGRSSSENNKKRKTSVSPEEETDIFPQDGWAYPEDMLSLKEIQQKSPETSDIKDLTEPDFIGKRIIDDQIPEPVMAPKKERRTADLSSSAEKRKTAAKTENTAVPAVSAKKADSAGPSSGDAYVLPPLSLLNASSGDQEGDSREYLRETAALLQQTLHTFGVEVKINHISCGPTVTRYELTPQMGIKVSRILSLTDDIKLNLAASDIRIEAPIPGKAAIGIEVPNKTNLTVMLRDLLESPSFTKQKSKLAFAVGKDIAGQPVIADIAKMPHLLIAGATGSGKSVCINALIMSILYKASPDEVKFIMIDPKVVELSVYNGIPHLFIPVVTDPKKATGALNWAVSEMTDRYQRFAEMGVRDLSGYNARIDAMPEPEEGRKPAKMARIVIIVDELADLMMVAKNEAEDAIVRLAQLARAAGLHLIIATQRPSVDVITGLIKANMPSRIALSVTSGVDSRTILDMNGAEKLLGKGDMLFYPQGYQKPARVQCAFVSDDEIQNVVDFLKEHHEAQPYDSELEEKLNHMAASGTGQGDGGAADQDAFFADAGKLIIEKDKASIGMLQRAFRIGFNRAARIMDQLCDAGVVGEEEGTKPRRILMSMEQFENYLEEN